jgi:hypothetical protein
VREPLVFDTARAWQSGTHSAVIVRPRSRASYGKFAKL